MENVHWESCLSKYADIKVAFCQQYASGDVTVEKDFPHGPKNITQTQIYAELKGVRNKYSKVLTHVYLHTPQHHTPHASRSSYRRLLMHTDHFDSLEQM